MKNKLVVIINSFKVPKIKKNFPIWNEISCTKLQLSPEPLTRGLRPQIPVLSVLCPQLYLLNPPKKIPGYATDIRLLLVLKLEVIFVYSYKWRYLILFSSLVIYVGL